MQAAIAAIAEVGYRNASFAQIAQRADLSSTGLISYHFAGRDELLEQVVTEIMGAIGAFMANRLAGTVGATGALRAYIEGNVEFIGAHRAEMKALLEIFINGGFHYDATADQAVVSTIEGILSTGQGSGEFRAFDTRVMATLIQRAVDGLPFLLAADPGIDLESYAAEVVTVFDLATRADR
ncbi:MAG: TetR family transcriptional regulator [Chloroflexota bacterium]|nr:MAG: TetR family transcriptional regulator [Chloroflexota bacterium]